MIRKIFFIQCFLIAMANALNAQAPIITDIQFEPTTCGFDNGSIKILATSSSGIEYSINGSDFQSSNSWTDLPSGGYTTIVKDANGATDSLFVFIEPSNVLSIISVDVTAATCGEDNGSLFITHTMGAGSITSSFDGDKYFGFFFHPNLSAGEYTAIVLDETSCSDTLNVEIIGIDSPVFKNIETNASGCEDINGSISLEVEGGTGVIEVSINGRPFSDQLYFDQLAPGAYNFILKDEIECQSKKSIIVSSEDCPLYIPNVFSPNGDGVNDVFELTAHPSFSGNILSLSIFSKWGALVYKVEDTDVNDITWNGELNDDDLESDIYIYVLEITYSDGRVEKLKGDIGILR